MILLGLIFYQGLVRKLSMKITSMTTKK